MNDKIKNYLGLALIATTLAVGYAAINYAISYPTYPDRSFSASGSGEVVAVPDIGEFTFSVLVEGGSDLDALQQQNTTKSNQVISYLEDAGVEKKDIRSEGYDISPRYDYNMCLEGRPCPAPQISGYTVSHTVNVKVRDLERAGELLSGVVANGANTVSRLNFSIDDPNKLQAEAMALAVSDAREKAKTIAEAGGFRVGKIVNIYVSEAYPYYDYSVYGRGGATDEVQTLPAPELEPGSQKVTTNVEVTFEIK